MVDVYGPIKPFYLVNSDGLGVNSFTSDNYMKFAWYPSTWKQDYQSYPFYGCSSTAAGGAAGTTGVNLYASTNMDLMQSTAGGTLTHHITAPTGQGVVYYQVYLCTYNQTTAGYIAVRRYPVGSTAQTIINVLSTAVSNGEPSQFELPMSPGEEFTILLTGACSSGQYTLMVDRLTV